jgi:hypothetical protein
METLPVLILKVVPETLFWELFAAFGMPPPTEKIVRKPPDDQAFR